LHTIAISAPLTTRTTPGIAAAFLVSILAIFACAWGERR